MKMRLFLSNIPYEAEERDLRDFFVEAGYLPSSVKLGKDRDTGNSRGFAFIDIESSKEGLRAIQDLDGQDFMGRRLNVQQARESRSYRGAA